MIGKSPGRGYPGHRPVRRSPAARSVRARIDASSTRRGPCGWRGWSLPLVTGPALSDALAEASRPVQLVASIGVWGAWAAALVATLVPTTVSLTALRLAAPSGVAATLVALVADGPGAATIAGLAGAWWSRWSPSPPRPPRRSSTARPTATSGACPCARPPACCWGRSSWRGRPWRSALAAGPLLLAARQWVTGAVALVVGTVAAVWGVRVMHTLARRWLVFVPTGVVIHDPLTLLDPILVRRNQVASFGPAPADSDALDLTGGASGLALELRLIEPLELLPVGPRRGSAELVEVAPCWSPRPARAGRSTRPAAAGSAEPAGAPPVSPEGRSWRRRMRRAPGRPAAR